MSFVFPEPRSLFGERFELRLLPFLEEDSLALRDTFTEKFDGLNPRGFDIRSKKLALRFSVTLTLLFSEALSVCSAAGCVFAGDSETRVSFSSGVGRELLDTEHKEKS